MVIRDPGDYQEPRIQPDLDPEYPRFRPSEELLQSRRTFLKWLIRGSYITFALAFALPALAIRTLTQEKEEIAAQDILVYASGVAGGVVSGDPINVNELLPGQAVQAFPRGKEGNQDNIIELVRLPDEANAPVIVAYSAICTHLGCTVLPELTDDGLIACPCHQSLFDPEDDAQVVAGLANRPLPSLPVAVQPDGTIIATGTFEGEVGPA